ncbi:1-acyl-sn-glycerol-3-phosphate acyltransferase [Parasulfuritortus cantonensis]|uniref:1-acyl-sn-glycerol-3-phosphate acyltransferase n=1 Tax=Parasulfuritortus cantonensis TaxID=2528202 RepID=A0A4R1BFA1_9PROT|nr:lysophospholipid acyltransferase family protein [Parasulfuritortus cantonensis]TCJ15784.1 1-acyl-sn-glycerol-3-phosphate acyltransferase [Parasulfuritortus cantonensis]
MTGEERPAGLVSALRRAYEYVVYYGFLLVFALMCLGWSLLSLPLVLLLPGRMGRRVGRWVISFGFRTYLNLLEWSGIVKCDLAELDGLAEQGPLVIAANHPSLIDVVLIVSRLPDAVCIIKASLADQFIFGGSARLAGYIRNISGSKLILDASRELQAGSHLLVFPEGTRTVGGTLQPFKGGFALISKKAQAPVQTVLIEINHPFLSKGRPLFDKPEFPLVLRARLGERFMPPAQLRPYIAKLEHYFRDELAPGQMERPS